MEKKALLFINGIPPQNLPEISDYSLIACTDGAFHYLKDKDFPLDKLDFISGDFDSHTRLEEDLYQEKFICTEDQEKTDFDKALQLILEKGFRKVDVYGGSGGEMDHFLGNLTAAFRFKEDMDIKFYDEFSEYFFAPKNLVLKGVKGKMISLYPFPLAENIITKGLNWELFGESLSQTGRIGTRNFAVSDQVSITCSEGSILIFIGQNYLKN